VPDVVAEIETALPLDITRGDDLDEANPDALALLLAVGVVRQGGRAAYLHEGHIETPFGTLTNARGRSLKPR
jgi:hypothetical protein